MPIQLTDSLKKLLKETAQQLKGAEKRKFIAQTVVALGHGGQSLAERELGWNRVTISKGIKELTTSITCMDNYRSRGRNKAEAKLPNLLEDIKKIVDSQRQVDPDFKGERMYTRLSAAEVRHQLIDKFGYKDRELPTSETIRVKLNDLGYCLKKTAKIKSQKNTQK
ncbi:ISAzo13-like element transposase-related protein [Nostoc sp. DedQUE05]|uniref:ISAzo13-like element transposase-related protein n=1 Tax=Nostoc sp. DedQUE05 TaxID=3075391 RepID=UPI003A0FE45D